MTVKLFPAEIIGSTVVDALVSYVSPAMFMTMYFAF
jgi:hypothetical protein